MKVLALAVSKYDMDGNKGGSLYTLPKKCMEGNQDIHGCPPMKFAIEHSLFQELEKVELPAFIDIEVDFIKAGGDKAKAVVESFERVEKGDINVGLIAINQKALTSATNGPAGKQN